MMQTPRPLRINEWLGLLSPNEVCQRRVTGLWLRQEYEIGDGL